MLSFDEFGDMADRLTEELPEEFFDQLSGGVILNQQVKYHEKSRPGDPLYILGEYCRDNTGRYILLYYGSFARVYWGLPDSVLEQKLRSVIRHEFRHHLEYRAFVRDLEHEDEDYLEEYRLGYSTNRDVDGD